MPPSKLSPRHRSRRWFLKSAALAGAGAAAAAAWARWVEPRWLEVGRHTAALRPDAPTAPMRLLHLSDFHASDVVPLAFIARAVRAGVELKPDLICVTGDFISEQFADTRAYAAVLAPLAAVAPTFACLGNHDGGAWAAGHGGYADTARVREVLAGAGIALLHNESRQLTLGHRILNLVGVGDLWADELDAGAAFAALPGNSSTPTLLLAHNPDSKDVVTRQAWDLLLSGHTHGGQLRLPLVGTPFAPVRDQRFVAGLHRWEGRWLHITKGVGNLHGLRFNCRPEISLLTLT